MNCIGSASDRLLTTFLLASPGRPQDDMQAQSEALSNGTNLFCDYVLHF